MESAIQFGNGDVFSGMHRPVEHTRNCQSSQVVAVIKIRHQDLQWSSRVARRHGNCFDDGFKQRLQIYAASFYVSRGSSSFGIGVQNRKVELLFLSIEIDEQIVDLV